jgi:hypothetical protein
LLGFITLFYDLYKNVNNVNKDNQLIQQIFINLSWFYDYKNYNNQEMNIKPFKELIEAFNDCDLSATFDDNVNDVNDVNDRDNDERTGGDLNPQTSDEKKLYNIKNKRKIEKHIYNVSDVSDVPDVPDVPDTDTEIVINNILNSLSNKPETVSRKKPELKLINSKNPTPPPTDT